LDRLLECALFAAGLIFGSFLNVCISRIPRDQSIVSPPSHCPACGAAVRWYHNIPLLGWLLLGGRCRDCGRRISFRYITVELLTALLFLACYLWFGWTWLTLKLCVFVFLVIGLIFMDAETGLLPREFTYLGIVLGLGFSWIAPTDTGGTEFLLRLFDCHMNSAHALWLLDAGLGALAGAGFFYLAWALFYLVRKKHGLGFGDIALMAMSGAFLGLKPVLLVIFAAPLLGVLYGVVLVLREGFAESAQPKENVMEHQPFLAREIPFGVLLGGCSLMAIFLGRGIWNWYLGMF
jgi:leader peptidase (prepilin peptidase)/N-methyltransferase